MINSNVCSEIFDQVRQKLTQRRYDECLSLLLKFRSEIVKWSLSLGDLSEFTYLMGTAYYNLSSYRQALVNARISLRLSQRAKDLTAVARAKQLLGSICWAQGLHRQAVEYLNECYVLRKNERKYEALYGTLVNIGLIHFVQGNLVQARSSFRDALEYAERFNQIDEQLVCRINLLNVLILRGELTEAQNALKLANRDNCSELNAIRLDRIAGWIQVLSGEYATGVSLLGETYKRFEAKGVSRDAVVAQEFIALAHILDHQASAAEDILKEILSRAELSASARAQTLRLLCEALVRQLKFDDARRVAAEAESAIIAIGEMIELGALRWLQAELAAEVRDWRASRKLFTEACRMLRDLGARFELGRCLLAAGLSCALESEERLANLYQARDLFNDMGSLKLAATTTDAIKQLQQPVSTTKPGRVTDVRLKSQGNSPPVPTIIASSPAMKEIIAIADKVKDTDLTILITGETGTGKDLLAEYIHYSSNRRAAPLVQVNSAALPDHLLEAELFGYKKGAYTGATEDKEGLIAAASGGSFFFNEIGDLPLALQAKLLRVIESKMLRRVGVNQEVHIDVRFIAATNHDLASRVVEGSFRRDLFYRLSDYQLHLPPLRDRGADPLQLIEHFLAQRGIELTSADAATLSDALRGYDWPGNIRELTKAVSRVAVLNGTNGKRAVAATLLSAILQPLENQ